MEEIHRSQSVSGFLILWRIPLEYLLSYLCWWDYVMICIDFFFFVFDKAHHYHSSTRCKSCSSSVKRVQDMMQRLIFAAGLWSKNIIPEATEAGLDINVYLFTQDSDFSCFFILSFHRLSTWMDVASPHYLQTATPTPHVLYTPVSPTSLLYLSATPPFLPRSVMLHSKYTKQAEPVNLNSLIQDLRLFRL